MAGERNQRATLDQKQYLISLEIHSIRQAGHWPGPQISAVSSTTLQ